MTNEDKETGFISHLAELRKRLINSFIFLIIFFIGCYFFAEHLYGFLVEPYAKAVKDDSTDRRSTALISSAELLASAERICDAWRRIFMAHADCFSSSAVPKVKVAHEQRKDHVDPEKFLTTASTQCNAENFIGKDSSMRWIAQDTS